MLEVVHGCPTEAEARLIAGLFEAAGIPSVLLDENLTTYQVVMACATRGYRIAVPRSRKEEAVQVLIENEYVDPSLQDEVPQGGTICTDCLHTVLAAGSSCPHCGAQGRWERADFFTKEWRVGEWKWRRKYEEGSS